MILICILFWLIDIDTSQLNFWWLVAFGNLSNFIFCGQGYFLGIMVLDESNVKIVNFMFIMLFISSNGLLCNLTSANWFITFLSKISPTRYNSEGFLRRVIQQIPDWSCPP